MLVAVTYKGPRDSLALSWTTDGLLFERDQVTLVPEPLVPLLKELPGHGFSVAAPASVEVGAVLVVPAEDPAPEPEPITADTDAEEAPAPPKRKPGRKPREIE